MSKLREKLLAAVAFDPDIDMRYDEENDIRYTYHARLTPLLTRLIACAVQLESECWCTSEGETKCHPCEKLAVLERAVGEM